MYLPRRDLYLLAKEGFYNTIEGLVNINVLIRRDFTRGRKKIQ